MIFFFDGRPQHRMDLTWEGMIELAFLSSLTIAVSRWLIWGAPCQFHL